MHVTKRIIKRVPFEHLGRQYYVRITSDTESNALEGRVYTNSGFPLRIDSRASLGPADENDEAVIDELVKMTMVGFRFDHQPGGFSLEVDRTEPDDRE
jgi:hypothetical protein